MHIRQFITFFSLPVAVFCLPFNFSVNEGECRVEADQNSLNLYVNEHVDLNWESFSIGCDEKVVFHQPISQSLAVNRVVGSNPTEIFGRLESNGQVILVNPHGILFGEGSQINVSSLIASTLDLLDGNRFKGANLQRLVNKGELRGLKDLILIGRHVENTGSMTSEQGSVLIGAGADFFYSPGSDPRLILNPTLLPTHEGIGIHNQGWIEGKNAELISDGYLYGYAISHSGSIHGENRTSLIGENSLTEVTGDVNGASLQVLGTRVSLKDSAKLFAEEILIGGDTQGENSAVFNADYTYVGENVTINADGKLSSNGGKVVVWGNQLAAMYGTITARGGEKEGDGGFVEISSPFQLIAKGFVDTRALQGKKGTLLLDPCAVTISGAATTPGVTPVSPPPPCPLPAQNYDFTGLAAANILNTDIEGYLLCNDVTIDASASGTLPAGSGSINITDSVQWMTESRLALIADDSINFTAAISANNNTIAPTSEIIYVEAPVITMGPNPMLGMGTGIGSDRGMVTVNAPISLTISGLTGTEGGIVVNQAGSVGRAEINAGNITIDATGATHRNLIYGSRYVNIQATGDIVLIAGSGPADQRAQIVAQGEMYLSAGGDIRLTGGGGAGFSNAVIDLFNPSGPGILEVMSAGNIVLQGGSGTSGETGILLEVGDGTVSVEASNISLNAGAAVGFNPAFIGLGQGNGSVEITATGVNGIVMNSQGSNFTSIGTTASFASAGPVTINTTNFEMNGSTDAGGMFGFSRVIANGGDLTLNATGTVSATGGGGAGGNSAGLTTEAGDPIFVTAENLNLNGGSSPSSTGDITTAGGGPISIFVENDINLDGSSGVIGSIIVGGGNGELFAQAGNSMTLVNSVIENLGSGPINLVVDANFPQPLIGSGFFSLDGASSVSSAGGAIRIFTALQSFNSIFGTLNGFSFTAGTLYIDTNQEVWCTYYPSFFGGSPFTVFYKDCIQQTAQQAETVVSESLVDLHPYNEYPGWWECFEVRSIGDGEIVYKKPYFITRRYLQTLILPKQYTYNLHSTMNDEKS